jgi:error-prone DNA polymerase
MGFYAPAQIVRDAREKGRVAVREIDVNASAWDNDIEMGDAPALRLGFRQIDGFRKEWGDTIAAARADRPFDSIENLARRAALPSRALRLLADADAFRSLGLDRRAALWEVRRTPAAELPLFAAARARELGTEPDAALPAMSKAEHVVADYQTTRLSLKDHPMTFLRAALTTEGVRSCAEIGAAEPGAHVSVAGIVLIRQRPGKGNAVFITIEDETGITNIVLWARQFEMWRRPVMAARLMQIDGVVQRSPEGVVHLMASRIVDRTGLLDRLTDSAAPPTPLSHAGEIARPHYPRGRPPEPHRHPRNVRLLPRSRDFH